MEASTLGYASTVKTDKHLFEEFLRMDKAMIDFVIGILMFTLGILILIYLFTNDFFNKRPIDAGIMHTAFAALGLIIYGLYLILA
jgi:hypothetical protein